jgi:hypothetical protein
VHEALSYLQTSEITQSTAVVCIDNSSAIDTLLYNKENSEPARLAIQTADALCMKG